jgi:spore coat protein H
MAAWLLSLWALICFSASGAASRNLDPSAGKPEDLFGPTNLYTFHLTIARDQWKTMNEEDQLKPNAGPLPGNNRPGGFGPMGPGPGGPGMGIEFKKGTGTLEFEGRSFGAIRVRFKGNSSFRFAGRFLKCSLKLDFNDVEKGRTFFGLTKLNLNNNAMDPSQLREALAYDIFRQGGVPACRTAFAKVYVTVPGRHDREYAGLYTVVEQVDERFLKVRYGAKGGMLLKPERLPGLPYWGDDWSAYTNRVQAKTAVAATDAARFIDFVKLLNQADDARFQAAVAEYVEVDEWLRFLALQTLLANMDSPLMTGHNYYLYLHPKSRKLIWIPWDLNEAFGGFLGGGTLDDQMKLSLDHPFTRVNSLAERLMQAPGVKDRYHQIVRGLLATNFNAGRLFPLMDSMASTIRSSLADDKMVSLAQFEAALSTVNQSQGLGGDTPGQPDFRPGVRGPGGFGRPRTPLKIFINQRVASAQLQLEGKTNGYVPVGMRPGLMGGPQPGPF